MTCPCSLAANLAPNSASKPKTMSVTTQSSKILNFLGKAGSNRPFSFDECTPGPRPASTYQRQTIYKLYKLPIRNSIIKKEHELLAIEEHTSLHR
jgi:hypothetical protein